MTTADMETEEFKLETGYSLDESIERMQIALRDLRRLKGEIANREVEVVRGPESDFTWSKYVLFKGHFGEDAGKTLLSGHLVYPRDKELFRFGRSPNFSLALRIFCFCFFGLMFFKSLFLLFGAEIDIGRDMKIAFVFASLATPISWLYARLAMMRRQRERQYIVEELRKLFSV